MKGNKIRYRITQPENSIKDFVESFWMIENTSDENKDIIVLPDGRVDIFFSCSAAEPYHVVLMGLETEPTKTVLQSKTITFAISLKLCLKTQTQYRYRFLDDL